MMRRKIWEYSTDEVLKCLIEFQKSAEEMEIAWVNIHDLTFRVAGIDDRDRELGVLRAIKKLRRDRLVQRRTVKYKVHYSLRKWARDKFSESNFED